MQGAFRKQLRDTDQAGWVDSALDRGIDCEEKHSEYLLKLHQFI